MTMGESPQDSRHDGRRLGSFLLSLLSGEEKALLSSERRERWDDPGQAGETDLVRQRGARGGSCRSAWNRHGGARGRQGTSEDGTISVKAPPAVALGRPSAGGQHPERREALPCRNARARFQRTYGDAGERVHRRSNRPKQAQANSSAPPRQAQAARTALVP